MVKGVEGGRWFPLEMLMTLTLASYWSDLSQTGVWLVVGDDKCISGRCGKQRVTQNPRICPTLRLFALSRVTLLQLRLSPGQPLLNGCYRFVNSRHSPTRFLKIGISMVRIDLSLRICIKLSVANVQSKGLVLISLYKTVCVLVSLLTPVICLLWIVTKGITTMQNRNRTMAQ